MKKEINEFKWNEAAVLPEVGSGTNGSRYSRTIIVACKMKMMSCCLLLEN